MLIAAMMMTAILAPDPSQDVKDARCVLAMVAYSANADAETKASVNQVMMFYAGKLAGRHSSAEVRDLVNVAEKESASLDMKAIGTACSQEVMEFGKVLQGL
jgi:hypothetical protein